ncbi:MAG: SAF domain-containing protein [Myxococcaceae bacterium]|nr:SAF domain-containing protein [Myxococcaceae bacterium]
MAASRKLKIILGLVAGLGVGGLGTGFIASLASYAVMKSVEKSAHRGWLLKPAVVASRDLAPGEKVTRDAMATRDLPEQFVTSSVVKPEAAGYVMDQLLIAPVRAGDALVWGFFSPTRAVPGPEPADRGDSEIWEACHAALADSPSASKPERTPADIRARVLSWERR